MKMRAHNLMEVKALIKGAYQSGSEAEYERATWSKHDGTFLCTSHIRDTEFELTIEYTQAIDGYTSVTCEVY
ncbi:hypothetical protein H0X48_06905 [Candidatus Dependentiae bacterium]|nr:hypothetical protein [Candidatus Dependentiae bacterium]